MGDITTGTPIRIALDLEGVLADTHVPVVEHSDILTEDSFHTWEFSGRELDALLDTLELVWRDHWREIPPSEPGLSGHVDDLREFATVELVTNSPGDPQDIRQWLDYHNIECDGYLFPGPNTDKAQLDFDRYVDDNPHMIDGVDDEDVLYFVTTPWNDHMDVETNGNVVRVGQSDEHALAAVVDYLRGEFE